MLNQPDPLIDSRKNARARLNWRIYETATPILSEVYRRASPLLRQRVKRRSTSGYDPDIYGFKGGELKRLTSNNYEKALRNIWKAEIHAPFLGVRDASKLEKAGASVLEEQRETVELMKVATSEQVRKEFEDAFSPEEREAIGWLMSLIGHGEAYALLTSSRLISVVDGTGARLGMAMQVMEEAKHFMVLRAMLKFLGIDQNIKDSAYMLFERIAAAPPYTMMFGMNVVLESFATTLFAQFADYPGLRHIVHVFHMDEARHVGFPKTYAAEGMMPEWVSTKRSEKLRRAALLLPALPLIFDYKPHFEAVGIDCFGFFGKFLAKSARLADDTGFYLPRPSEELLAEINLLFNAYTLTYEPERYEGYRDYTRLGKNEYRKDIMEREIATFGARVFGLDG
ncbi:MAG: ferritin-like domain-containing protein [Candidatus Dadabacteria bacterium]|nr:MAG: ferritin-like domain-containing protein [Candidatus Dadabacteria bacterium]